MHVECYRAVRGNENLETRITDAHPPGSFVEAFQVEPIVYDEFIKDALVCVLDLAIRVSSQDTPVGPGVLCTAVKPLSCRFVVHGSLTSSLTSASSHSAFGKASCAALRRS
ncbi:MAG TPA: hypothetical protein VLS93_08115, partial [Anaeromyxobacteraceae bacterium]|nr:hypothetical protein [Anaeromyxobacteraceae bacterium]